MKTQSRSLILNSENKRQLLEHLSGKSDAGRPASSGLLWITAGKPRPGFLAFSETIRIITSPVADRRP